MAGAAAKSLMVVGGTGFFGHRLCQRALRAGWAVTSISRRGDPPSHIAKQAWAQKVNWVKGDCLKPDTFSEAFHTSNAIVHTVGTLLENAQYKKLLGGESSGVSDYNTMNRDTAIAVADEAVKHSNIEAMAYISAHSAAPFVPSGYIRSKREAEEHLLALDGLRTLIYRPGFLYSEESPQRLALASAALVAAGVMDRMPSAVQDLGLTILGKNAPDIANVMSTSTLADAVLIGLDSADCQGVFDIDLIHQLIES